MIEQFLGSSKDSEGCGDGTYLVKLDGYITNDLVVNDFALYDNSLWLDTKEYGAIHIDREYFDGVYQDQRQYEKIKFNN